MIDAKNMQCFLKPPVTFQENLFDNRDQAKNLSIPVSAVKPVHHFLALAIMASEFADLFQPCWIASILDVLEGCVLEGTVSAI